MGKRRPALRGTTRNGGKVTSALFNVGSYFLSLTIQSARCFGTHSQTLNLSNGHGRPSQWTVLLGDNGTGKTTILQALASLAPTVEVPHVPDLLESNKWCHCGLFPYWGLSRGNVPATLSADVSFGKPLSSGQSFLPATFRHSPGSSTIYSLDGPYPPICYGYGASRRLVNSSLKERPEADHNFASLVRDDADLRNAEEWLLQLDYSAARPSAVREHSRQRLDQVRALLTDTLPEVDDIRFAEPAGPELVPHVEFSTPYGWVPLAELGFGYRTLIAWMVDFASRMVERYPDSPDPLKESAVVLVDEIDLHLHPSWQRKLLEYLTERFPNTQFIVTAHSPLIVQSAASVDANIALLRREDDHVVIDNDIEAIRGWRVDQILTSDLFGLPTARPPEFDKLLERRKTLLTKPKLTKKDQTELTELEKQIGHLPTGDRADDQPTQELIAEAAELLKKHTGTAG